MITLLILLRQAILTGMGPKIKNTVGQQKKKVSEVESAALQRLKNELKLRDARQDLADANSIMTRLDDDQKEMDRRKKELVELMKEKARKQQQILDETEIAKYKVSETGSGPYPTVGELKHTCFMLHKINDNIRQREIRADTRLVNSRDSFYNLKLRDTSAKELLNLLSEASNPRMKRRCRVTPSPTGSAHLLTKEGTSDKIEASCKRSKKSRSRIENRRQQLTDNIFALTENFQIMKRLNHIRSSSDEWKEKSLEEYIDSNIERVDIEIQNLGKEIRLINTDIRDTCELIEERKLSISGAKKATREFSKKSITTAPAYRKVICHNEVIQTELDKQLAIGEELLKENWFLAVELEDRNAEAENSEAAQEIRYLILENMLQDDFEIGGDIEENDRKYKQLAQNIEDDELTLKKMRTETSSMKSELDESSDKLNATRSSINEMEMKNEACVKVMSLLSQQALEMAAC